MTHPVSAGVTAWATVRATFVVVAAASRSWSATRDRKSTRLNSSHSQISYAVFCLKKKKQNDVTEHRSTNRSVFSIYLEGTGNCGILAANSTRQTMADSSAAPRGHRAVRSHLHSD